MEVQRFQDKTQMYRLNTVVVGTGAAGYNAADSLWSLGQHDIAVVTDHVRSGTSRNTGSDKQTYYKLTLAGSEPDSVGEMAQTLFAGQCVDGDIALCEASLSVPSFMKLVELGVPFPSNRWGEYVGYKTDHDPRRRATSVGPYTSRYMTECLERAVLEKEIPVLDHLQVISVLSDGTRAYGLLCLDTSHPEDEDQRFVLFQCKNIIFATGGPAGMYADSVYPVSQFGASGLAFEAGADGKNLTEWQYGLASVQPRWNVSGTYMQAIPRFISAALDGTEEREFLSDFFADRNDLMAKVFLKGYQWPFDVRKVDHGSSIIDILVYMETCRGRKVYLDYRANPGGGKIDFHALGEEAYTYLNQAGACFGTPLERLEQMNAPAVEFYRSKGIDLSRQPLEIALCAQHNNGGLAIDSWWQTNLVGFFAAGEVSASHGVYRPGGSALNAGQTGSARAAQYIAFNRRGAPEFDREFQACAEAALILAKKTAVQVMGGESNVRDRWNQAAQRMSCVGAAIRNSEEIKETLQQTKSELDSLESEIRISSPKELWRVYRLRDMLICQYVYLSALINYIDCGGKSRGSALYTDRNGQKLYEQLPDCFTFCLEAEDEGKLIQEVSYKDGEVSFHWRPARPIPESDDFFENVWRDFRNNKNIF